MKIVLLLTGKVTKKLLIFLVLSIIGQMLCLDYLYACHATIYSACTDDYENVRRFKLCHKDGWREEDYEISYLAIPGSYTGSNTWTDGSICPVPPSPQWKKLRLNKKQCVIVEIEIANGSDPVSILTNVTGQWELDGTYHGYDGGINCRPSTSTNGSFTLTGTCNCGSDELSCLYNFPLSTVCHKDDQYYQCGTVCGNSCAEKIDS